MADALKCFYRGALTAASANLFTVAAGKQVIITEIILANNSTTTDIKAKVQVGGVSVVPNKLIPKEDAIQISTRIVVDAGLNVTGFAGTAATIDCTICGIEVS